MTSQRAYGIEALINGARADLETRERKKERNRERAPIIYNGVVEVVRGIVLLFVFLC